MEFGQTPDFFYLEATTGASADLECLKDSDVFRDLVWEKAISLSTAIRFSERNYVTLNREILPQIITDAIYLPDLVTVSDLRANLDSIATPSDDENADPTWTLNVRCDINADRELTITTTPKQTLFIMDNMYGDPVSAVFPPEVATQTLLALYRASLDEHAESFAPNISGDAWVDPVSISALLKLLGKGLGTTSHTTTANLSHAAYPNRHLMVTVRSTETPRANGSNIDYYLADAFAPQKVTAIISSQGESHSTTGETHLENRYGKRFPLHMPGEQLLPAIQMGLVDNDYDAEEIVVLNRAVNPEQYHLVSAAIMGVINAHLAERQ